jgi:ribosome-binding protein aMBF1 (putative translation factor)
LVYLPCEYLTETWGDAQGEGIFHSTASNEKYARRFLSVLIAEKRILVQNKLAARIDVTPSTVSCWLAGKWRLKPTTLTKLRAFLDVEAKRKVAGDGIKPIEAERDLTIK